MAGPACACTFRWIAGKKRSGGDAFTEEAAQPQDGGSTGCDCNCRNITQSPYDGLLKNEEPIRDLRETTEEYVRSLQADGKEDRGLMRSLGEKLQELTGHSDFAFFSDLPPSGSKAVVLRALCPLRDLTLGDGDATISGAFAASLKRVLEPLGFELVLSNIAMVCWRKGKEGKELTGAAAGCVDPAGIVLDLLAVVKELHMYGLLAAGVVVSGVLVSSNAAVASFGYDPAVVKHGARYTPTTGLFNGIPIVFLSHLKYVAPGPVFLRKCGGPLRSQQGPPARSDDRLHRALGQRVRDRDGGRRGKRCCCEEHLRAAVQRPTLARHGAGVGGPPRVGHVARGDAASQSLTARACPPER